MKAKIGFAVLAAALSAAAAPDGNEWQSSMRLSEGKEKTRAFFFSFDTKEEALSIFPDGDTERIRSLNAPLDAPDAWRFYWSKDPASRPAGFQDPAFDVSVWETINVPSSWQAWSMLSI